MSQNATRRRTATVALVALAATGLATAPSHAANLPAGSTAILSGQSSLFDALPAPVNDSWSEQDAISADGRFVVFASDSDGLTDEDDDRRDNIYVKDRETGRIELVNRATGAAGAPADDNCDEPAISDDGRAVAFSCNGSLDPADTNSQPDIYVRRLDTDTTHLVSRASGDGTVSNGDSREPALSANGDFVAFTSDAGNLVAGVTPDVEHVYRRSLTGDRATVLVSRKDAGLGGGGEATGREPSIDGSGNLIAFTTSDRLHTDDTNNRIDVYVRDVSAGTSSLESRATGAAGPIGNGDSSEPAISANGRAIVFTSRARNLDERDTDDSPDIYLRAIQGTVRPTTLMSINDVGVGVKSSNARQPVISGDGFTVGFVSATRLHPDDKNGVDDAYVRFTGIDTLEIASRATGTAGALSHSGAVSIALNGDGSKVVSSTYEGSITPDIDPDHPTVFVRDRSANPQRTEAVSRPAGSEPFVNQGNYSQDVSLSADGRYAAFVTEARGLGIPYGTFNAIAVRDRVTGDVRLVSRADGPDGELLGDGVDLPSISADGRRVAFVRYGASGGVWVRDLVDDTTVLASRASGANGTPAGGGASTPSLDADGSRVAFITPSRLSADDNDMQIDGYLRDLSTNETILVSRGNGAAGTKANNRTGDVELNGDGTRVAFMTEATNLAPNDTDTANDIYLRDVAANTTRLVSATPAGVKGNSDAVNPSIDLAGQRIVFASYSTNLPDSTRNGTTTYLRDLEADTLAAVSRADGPNGTPVTSTGLSVISPDGRAVAFETQAPIAEGVPATRSQTYVRDLAQGRTVLASRDAAGQPSARSAHVGDISSGGGCVAMDSRGLVGGHTDYPQIYLRALAANCGDPVRLPPGGPGAGGNGGDGGGGSGGGTGGRPSAEPDRRAPVITGARLSRRKFRVARGATAVAAATGRGTVLSLRSSETATLTLRFERMVPGKKAGSRCRPVKKRPKKRGCTIRKRAGSITRSIRGGNAKVTLTGRIGARALARGDYRLTLTATDAAGNTSKPARVTFALVK